MQVERSCIDSLLSIQLSGGRVSNTWATNLKEGDNSEKSLLIPHKIEKSHDYLIKEEIRFKTGPRLIS